jgi:hypothetical protein
VNALHSSAASPFIKTGLSRALPAWLVFRRSLSHDNWQEAARQELRRENANNGKGREEATDDKKLVQRWLHKQDGFNILDVDSAWLVAILGSVIGALTMAGALTYSGSAPVNLWILLGLFCVVPLIMSLLALVGWFAMQRRASQPASQFNVWATLFYRPLMKAVGANALNTSQLHLLRPWLMWKMQSLALAFQVSAILTFCLALVFRDVAFGWSSTIIQGGDWMTKVLQGIALPWQWLVNGPSSELMEQSRFYRGSGTFDSALLGQWWPYLLLAMLSYGLIPRMLVALWMWWQVKKLLLAEISSSGELERFIRAVHYVDSAKPPSQLDSSEAAPPKLQSTFDSAHQHVLAWQCKPTGIPTKKALGSMDWSEDEVWLKNTAPSWHQPVTILANMEQTPTAELADLIGLIRELNLNISVEITLLLPAKLESTRQQGLLKSWRHFADFHSLQLHLLAR